MIAPFSKKPAHERKIDVQKIFNKYPDKIPIFVQKEKSCHDLPDTMTQKYLVPRDLTLGQFLYTIRKRIMLPPEKALFIFFDQHLLNTESMMIEIYEKHHSKEDNMLYALCSTESTFG
jgi:GABA(A) receptor-associated protein